MRNRRDTLFLILGGFFLTNALLGELIGSKLSRPCSAQQFANIAVTQYVYKFTVAVLLTPLIYAEHSAAERFLGRELAHELAAEAARQSGSARSAG